MLNNNSIRPVFLYVISFYVIVQPYIFNLSSKAPLCTLVDKKINFVYRPNSICVQIYSRELWQMRKLYTSDLDTVICQNWAILKLSYESNYFHDFGIYMFKTSTSTRKHAYSDLIARHLLTHAGRLQQLCTLWIFVDAVHIPVMKDICWQMSSKEVWMHLIHPALIFTSIVIMSYGSNWITLLLLFTSAPLGFCVVIGSIVVQGR